MSLNFLPWTRYETLAESHLVDIGNLLRSTQRDCVALHDVKAGDDVWSLSCRVYSRRCHAITQLSLTSTWLQLLPDAQQPAKFTFAIRGIPFRFYHGEAADTPDKYKIGTHAELQQFQTAFDFGIAPVRDKILRLAADTDPKSLLVSRVTLVEMDNVGNLTGIYVVPETASDANVEPMRRDGVVTPKAAVKPLKDKTQTDKQKEKQIRRHDGRIH